MSQRTYLRRRRRPSDSQITQTFEEELRDLVDPSPAPRASVAPSASDATSEALDSDFDSRFQDSFEGIDWDRLSNFYEAFAHPEAQEKLDISARV